MVDCPAPYMGTEQPAAPPDPDLPLQGPFGSGVSGPMFGKCPVGTSAPFQRFIVGCTVREAFVQNPSFSLRRLRCAPMHHGLLHSPRGTGMQWGSQEFAMMHTLAHKLVHSFSHGHGHLFWNFRTELERRWSFLEAWRAGWLPRNISDAAHPAVAKVRSHRANAFVHTPRPCPSSLATGCALALADMSFHASE
mmetsp:Transcript_19194/g.57865  ORF Transcript_19194/g.57865 Transcript_19194/m.57865 type:complete len:193 (+) Transcript_19194:695-1273(+)